MAISCPKCSGEMKYWKRVNQKSSLPMALFVCPKDAFVKSLYLQSAERDTHPTGIVCCANCGKITPRGDTRCECRGRTVIGRNWCGECGALTSLEYATGEVEHRTDGHKLSCRTYQKVIAARNPTVKALERETPTTKVGDGDDGNALWEAFVLENGCGAIQGF